MPHLHPAQPDRVTGPPQAEDEEGSLVSEYGLLAILGATIAGLAIKWASGGAIFALFGAVFDKARAIVGV